MADLMTLSEFKEWRGIPTGDTQDDARYIQAIASVSALIQKEYRDFTAAPVTEARIFQHEGDGFVEIDDATAVTAVEMAYDPTTYISLLPEEWNAAPFNGEVYEYIELAAHPGMSPEMGFTRNLDVLFREGRFPRSSYKARVTGTWGWLYIPEDVIQAAVWTIEYFKESPEQTSQSESIAGYSRSSSGGAQVAGAIPRPAREILDNYRRMNV